MNDRSLQVEADLEYEAEVEELKNSLQHTIDKLNRQISTLNSAGWRDIQEELIAQYEYASNKLRGDDLNTMEAIAHVRGQMRAFEFLIALPQYKRSELDMNLQSLKGLKEE